MPSLKKAVSGWEIDTHNELKTERKLPRQVDSSKVEFPADCKRASKGVRSPNESCGLSSLYSSIHCHVASLTCSREVNRYWLNTSSPSIMENQPVDPEQVVLNTEIARGQLRRSVSEHKELRREEDSVLEEKKSKSIDVSGSVENVEKRLAKVQELLEKGLITKEQASKKRESILNEI